MMLTHKWVESVQKHVWRDSASASEFIETALSAVQFDCGDIDAMPRSGSVEMADRNFKLKHCRLLTLQIQTSKICKQRA